MNEACVCASHSSQTGQHIHTALQAFFMPGPLKLCGEPTFLSLPCQLQEDKNELVPPSILDGGLACVSCQYQDNKHILVPSCSVFDLPRKHQNIVKSTHYKSAYHDDDEKSYFAIDEPVYTEEVLR